MDESGITDILIYKNRLGNLINPIKIGDYIRIRSIKIDNKIISLNVYSNIMRFPLNSFNVKLFHEKIESQYKELNSKFLSTKIINEEPKINEKNYKVSSFINQSNTHSFNIVINNIRLGKNLNESKIFNVNNESDLIEFMKDSKEYCKLKCSIITTNSKNPSKIIFGTVKSKDKYEVYSLEEISFKELYSSNYFYKTILTVRLNQDSLTFFDIILNTIDSDGIGFLGVEPGDVLSDYSLYSRISSAISKLFGIDKYVEVILKKVLQINGKNIELQIVGDYNNLIFD